MRGKQLDLDSMVRQAATLDEGDLVKLAKALFEPTEQAHWVTEATVLGRVETERIWEKQEHGAHRSGEEWAKEKLSMSRGTYRQALILWRLMQRNPSADWRKVPRPRALALAEVLDAGADTERWIRLAVEAPSAAAFDESARAYLAAEEFKSLRIRYPESMGELVDEAFQRAFAQIEFDKHVPATEWRRPQYAHRALEVVCQQIIDVLPPAPKTQGELSDLTVC